MIRKLLQQLDDTFKEYTVVTVHANGHSYELMNFSIPLEANELEEHLNEALKDFNNKYKRVANTYLNKDKELYDRMVKVETQFFSPEKREVYTRLFTNMHKAKSNILSMKALQIELYHFEEGLPLS